MAHSSPGGFPPPGTSLNFLLQSPQPASGIVPSNTGHPSSAEYSHPGFAAPVSVGYQQAVSYGQYSTHPPQQPHQNPGQFLLQQLQNKPPVPSHDPTLLRQMEHDLLNLLHIRKENADLDSEPAVVRRVVAADHGARPVSASPSVLSIGLLPKPTDPPSPRPIIGNPSTGHGHGHHQALRSHPQPVVHQAPSVGMHQPAPSPPAVYQHTLGAAAHVPAHALGPPPPQQQHWPNAHMHVHHQQQPQPSHVPHQQPAASSHGNHYAVGRHQSLPSYPVVGAHHPPQPTSPVRQPSSTATIPSRAGALHGGASPVRTPAAAATSSIHPAASSPRGGPATLAARHASSSAGTVPAADRQPGGAPAANPLVPSGRPAPSPPSAGSGTPAASPAVAPASSPPPGSPAEASPAAPDAAAADAATGCAATGAPDAGPSADAVPAAAAASVAADAVVGASSAASSEPAAGPQQQQKQTADTGGDAEPNGKPNGEAQGTDGTEALAGKAGTELHDELEPGHHDEVHTPLAPRPASDDPATLVPVHPTDFTHLTAQLLELFQRVSPTRDDYHHKDVLLRRLQALVQAKWPGGSARLHPFGSSANNFSLRRADLDVCLMVDSKVAGSAKHIIHQLGGLLKNNSKHYINIKILSRARVPIVKFTDRQTGVSCDICINNMLPIHNTQLLATYTQLDCRVRELACCIKFWAKRRQVNEPYQGTLSSYSWTLMVINYLQQQLPPILPCLQQLREPNQQQVMVQGYDCTYFRNVNALRDFSRRNATSVGELLAGFFRLYAQEFDYENSVVSVRLGRFLSKQEKRWDAPNVKDTPRDQFFLTIEDPFEITHNLGRIVDKNTLAAIQGEIKRAYRLICDGVPFTEGVCEPYIEGQKGRYN
eukprot:TRINITY_DN5187_c0_g1_i1.p1 TRINITY_DN5187_c0_g1~~TRINITY_DN5187_c0_g1_i1.p1  ORF type:complete len:881 (-),score=217.39 TRINITY_DN5187_c0_g1_i1:37-2679(-)